MLRELNDDDLCASDFVITLLDVFWDNYKNQMLLRVFVPYIIYLLLTLNYMVNFVTVESSKEFGNDGFGSWGEIQGSILLLATCYQVYIEAFQLK